LALLAFALILFMPSSSIAVGLSTLDTIKARGVLLWGSDSEGGAPYVFPNPKDPSKLIGFELDILEAIAKQFGVQAQLVQTAWDSLIQALERGDYDMAMNGLEIVERRNVVCFPTVISKYAVKPLFRRGYKARIPNKLKML
jgi:polar amino acid transport system substrate-binding protein